MYERAILALGDGKVFYGRAFGARGETTGEVVFNTSMTGYQEILSDPSYKGQIVAMTYPHIGNYGINKQDVESWRPWVEGFIVREASLVYSNWRAATSLEQCLRDRGIVAITGVATRALTRHIRAAGAMKGILSTIDLDERNLVRKAAASPGLIGRDLVREVTCAEPYPWTKGLWEGWELEGRERRAEARYHVIAYDFGMKQNILRLLTDHGCRVTVVPADTHPTTCWPETPTVCCCPMGLATRWAYPMPSRVWPACWAGCPSLASVWAISSWLWRWEGAPTS